MGSEQIKELINGQEPIAIVRYFEWAVFSHDHSRPKYLLIRINGKNKDIYQMDIPESMVPYLVSRLDNFQEVIRQDSGIVWERMAFRDKVRALVSRPKIRQFIDQR